MLENVLAVGEDPARLVVYAALGRAARDWPSHDAIVTALKDLRDDETLVIQSGKPIGILQTHSRAPIVIMANCNIVGRWATPENFYALEEKGLICWGGLTAGDWQYIGSQGVIQGTYEIFMRIAEKHFGGDLSGRIVLTAGLGGMGGAQPLAGKLAGAAILCVEVDPVRIAKRLEIGLLDVVAASLDEALDLAQEAKSQRRALSIGLTGNAAEIFPAIAARGLVPDVVTDQTSAHDLVYGYVPLGRTAAEMPGLRSDSALLIREGRASIAEHVRAMLAFQRAGSIVFDNGNLIRSQALEGGVADAFDIPIFTEAFLRPLFSRAIGPFRWIALSGARSDIVRIDQLVLDSFPDNAVVTRWIRLAREHVPVEGLPARIAWLGHGERTRLALEVNAMVRTGELAGPVGFTRDHLDAAAMTHPTILTENMLDGSDAIADWPLLDALAMCSSQADLVAIHSGGGGYAGFSTSAGVTVIADGSAAADERIALALTNDTALGVMRYADAGYADAQDEVRMRAIRHIALEQS
ncbi:urocanate hydratase [Sphingobium sp. TA15]|nr:urocanate hydratase [Sphingobium sp. TA15]